MEKKDFVEWIQKLENGYEANENVRSQLAQVDLLAIVGPTGVGKTTIIDKLGLHVVRSDVSRLRRDDERNEKHYHFRDDYLEILKEVKAGEYAQFLINGSNEFYGTRASEYPDSGVCTMAIVAAAIPVFRKLGFRRVLPIYIMPPGYVEWMRRIGTVRAGDINIRIAEAVESIKLALRDDSYHFVLNDNIDLAVKDIQAIMVGDEVDEHRATLARETADILLERLGDQDDSIYFSSDQE
jgi:guanylate kinase